MADKIDHGGFAFPFLSKTYEGNWNPFRKRYVPTSQIDHDLFPGMSMRQYFAGQALAGLCANPALVDIKNRIGLTSEGIAKTLAEASADLADALIAELSNPKSDS